MNEFLREGIIQKVYYIHALSVRRGQLSLIPGNEEKVKYLNQLIEKWIIEMLSFAKKFED